MSGTQDDTADDTSAADDLWAEAFAEQAAAEDDDTGTDADTAMSDWDLAMAEQEADSAQTTDAASSKPDTQAAGDSVFAPLEDVSETERPLDLDAISNIPVSLSVELGSTYLSIRQLLDLGPGSAVELDEMANAPMNIFVGGHLVAQGEVVVANEQYGIRITKIIDRSSPWRS